MSTTTTTTTTLVRPPWATESGTPLATPTQSSSDSFVGNTSSTVLFFLALAIGASVALIFVYFTIRYFIRAKYGLLAYPITQRGIILTIPENLPRVLDSDDESIDDSDLQQQINYVREHVHNSESFLISQIYGRGGRRRRGGRFSRMKKLKQSEVEELFPEQTYYKWLHGGQDESNQRRAGILQEENDLVAVVSNDDITRKTSDFNSELDTNTTITSRNINKNDGTNINSLDNVLDSNLNQSVDVIELNEHQLGIVSSSTGNKNLLADSNTTFPKLENIFEENSKSSDEGDQLTNLQKELHFTSGTCAICLEVFDDESIVRGLVCGHAFHAECVDPWLTKRRACCPMCKRDYFYKSEVDMAENTTGNEDSQGPGSLNQRSDSNHGTNTEEPGLNGTTTATTENGTQTGEDEFVLDVRLIRRDPTLRAIVQEMIPMSERVRIILDNPRYNDANINVNAQAIADKKFSRWYKRAWWRLMGISKDDIYNRAAYDLFKTYKLQQQRERLNDQSERATEAEPTETGEATETTEDPTTVIHNTERDLNQDGYELREMVERRV